MSTSCVICNGTEESLTKVTPKGNKTLVEIWRKRNAFGVSTIVFDGYREEPSPKDQENARRANQKCHNFSISNDTILTVSQQSFLANSNNKTGLIRLLMLQLEEDGHTVKQAVSDADTMIVGTALHMASAGHYVTVFANDKDIIIMLLIHC